MVLRKCAQPRRSVYCDKGKVQRSPDGRGAACNHERIRDRQPRFLLAFYITLPFKYAVVAELGKAEFGQIYTLPIV